MSKIEKQIKHIEILAKDLVEELREFDKECNCCYRDKPYISTPSQHRARFNRLRVELNKKCVELEKIYKGGRYE